MNYLNELASQIAAFPPVASLQAYLADNALPLGILWLFVVVLLINAILHLIQMECIEEIARRTPQQTRASGPRPSARTRASVRPHVPFTPRFTPIR